MCIEWFHGWVFHPERKERLRGSDDSTMSIGETCPIEQWRRREAVRRAIYASSLWWDNLTRFQLLIHPDPYRFRVVYDRTIRHQCLRMPADLLSIVAPDVQIHFDAEQTSKAVEQQLHIFDTANVNLRMSQLQSMDKAAVDPVSMYASFRTSSAIIIWIEYQCVNVACFFEQVGHPIIVYLIELTIGSRNQHHSRHFREIDRCREGFPWMLIITCLWNLEEKRSS